MRDAFSNYNYQLNETPTVIIENPNQQWTVKSGWITFSVTNASSELIVTTQEFWNIDYAKQEEYIAQAQKLVGSNNITVSDSSLKLEPGMSITLDGMAKGYAVDAALTVLKSKGIERALVDAGGDIATMGTKPEDEKWLVGLRSPEDTSASVTEFELSGEAIATSGNYERYFDENKSVGHIMDPTTGRSVFKCSSASIIADNCTVADILATAVFVVGPEPGIELVETLPSVETFLLGYEDPTEIFRSSGMDRYEIED
jgi:thiamine biosynthesis lipoprotein